MQRSRRGWRFQERGAATLEAICRRVPVIYQALFTVTAPLAGRDYEIVGSRNAGHSAGPSVAQG